MRPVIVGRITLHSSSVSVTKLVTITSALFLFVILSQIFHHFSVVTPCFSDRISKTSRSSTEDVSKNHTTQLVTRSLTCPSDIYVVILVTSHAWTGHDRRASVRDTWGKYVITREANASESWKRAAHEAWGREIGKRNTNGSQVWKPYFIAATRPYENETDRFVFKARSVDLRSEKELHKDIIEGDFVESWDMLPYKLQVGFEWVSLYCPTAHFVFKTDDDVYVNTKHLLMYLNSLPLTDVYTGFTYSKAHVMRHGKYKVEYEEYNKTMHPPFASGATMTYSIDVITKLVSIFPRVKPYRLEDVYIGLCAEKLGIKMLPADRELQKPLWDIFKAFEEEDECDIFPHAIVRAVYFTVPLTDLRWDKRWCIHKLYHET